MTERIYHVAIADDWTMSEAMGEYTASTRGVSFDDAGFVHAATAADVPFVLDSFYADLALPLVLLEIDPDGLASRSIGLEWEEQGGRRFPHILAPIPWDDDVVVAVHPLARRADGWETPALP
ncbi:DUF952 domain-containing protein [Cnuibacter sp. UC19_7]|uniref:DUF952 domain-containing protein n=1 Tax=Cnuibacter sp. UC19_7 TaxID=3350166 RepID=UPI00366D7522